MLETAPRSDDDEDLRAPPAMPAVAPPPREAQVRRFLGKALLLGLPFLLCCAIYVVGDPFRVIYHYDFGDYYVQQPWELDRDYVSTEMLLERYRKTPFDAFIFGSSRSYAYYCPEWQKYIHSAHPFHYPGGSETLYGLWCKVRLLDRLGLPIHHTLLVLDHYTLASVDVRKDHFHIVHPAASGNGWAEFEWVNFKAIFCNGFMLKYLDYSLFHTCRRYMAGTFLKPYDFVRTDPVTNDLFFVEYDRELAANPEKFYADHAAEYEQARARRGQTDPVAIAPEPNERYLNDIAAIFRRHRTDCRVVINPLHDEVALNPADVSTLRRIFGRDRVFDCSGVNVITVNRNNFYDPWHYRKPVADRIMHEIYTARPAHWPAQD